MSKTMDKKIEKTTEELCGLVKKCATEVYKILGAGYNEEVYEEAMGVEFRRQKISFELERNSEIFYKEEKVGIHRLDFLVEAKLVVELKAAATLSKSNIVQLSSYLRTLKLSHGLLINFPYPQEDEPEFQVIEP